MKTQREKRLEALVIKAQDIVIVQRETIRSQQELIRIQCTRIKAATETLRYFAEQYDSPLARAAAENLNNSTDQDVTPVVPLMAIHQRRT